VREAVVTQYLLGTIAGDEMTLDADPAEFDGQ
jgi:hypothetical protein